MNYWTEKRIASRLIALKETRTYGSQAAYSRILDQKSHLWLRAASLGLTDKVLSLLGH